MTLSEEHTRVEELIRTNQLDDAERALGASAVTGGDQPAEQLYLQGRLAERRHEWESCVDSYERALEVRPDHTEAMFRLAYVLDLLGEDERAIELYEKCTAESTTHVGALMNLSVLYEDQGRYAEAQRCIDCVLAEFPADARARLFKKDVEASLTMYYDEDQERIREKRDAVLDTPIGDFELSVRSRNCLKQMSIRTLGDLLRTSEQELLAYKNFGETSLNEIKAVLAQAGVTIGQEAPTVGPEANVPAPPRAVATGDAAVLLSTVSELELSVRSRKCLQRLGVTSIGELAACTEAELLAIKNFGQTSLVEIKRVLADRGLALRGQN